MSELRGARMTKKRVMCVQTGLLAAMVLSTCCAIADTTTVEIRVTLFAPPPCTINGNKVIDVDFGNSVQVSRINGTDHLKTVDYSIVCLSNTSNAMMLQVQGVPTAFDRSALQTNVADFGIALRADGQELNINEWIKFTYPDKPVLQAVPVKKAGVTLTGGEFSVGAALLVAYQ